MSKKHQESGEVRSTKHSDIQQEPRRVASRMERGGKNRGNQ